MSLVPKTCLDTTPNTLICVDAFKVQNMSNYVIFVTDPISAKHVSAISGDFQSLVAGISFHQ